uniref:Glucan endo-1,3-beta-D-glucosidase n=1 Tax=Oryza meridionalis TaxID=40149 RepID=A0A0E0D3L8_9ORYZ
MARRGGVESVLAVLTLLVGLLAPSIQQVQSIGVCYGTHGDNLPAPGDVVQLYQSNHIDAMRIYLPNDTILHALRGTNIAVIVDAPDVRSLASDDATNASSSAAQAWVQANVQPYYPDVNIKYIAVGNEVEGDDRHKILPAMNNIRDALSAAGLGGHIKVSTSVKMNVIASSPLPSKGAFAEPSVMGPIVKFLASNGSPLLANVYPYYAYMHNDHMDANFTLFLPSSMTMDDNGLTYTNLFDAMVDSIYSAMEKEGGPDVPVVVSETGWPSADGRGASKDNAMVYNQNLISHVGKGTPKRPVALEVYMFAMFDENQKTGDHIEKHFGLFNPDKSSVYCINFSGTSDYSCPQSQRSMGLASRPVYYAMVIVCLNLVLLFWPANRL